ncbi:MAG: sugar ABC transporter substrate-binding protein, partial [Shinella sp.]|nr:sugar ABC transporter substrate-binding protein [Shinella sp.]
MKFKIALASATILAASMFSAASADDLTIGFSQIGSE